MHIPDGFLAPRVWGTLDGVSVCFVALGLHRVSRELEEKAIPLMGVLAAFVFAAQMINLPMAGGTSAHFLGGALLGALLGPWAGLIVLTMVLMVQCFVFQDGGVAALGANIFNMGIIGSWGSAFLYRGFRRFFRGPRGLFWSGFWTAWSSIVLSAVSCAFLLSLSGVASWPLGLGLIGGVHSLIGVLEGVVTGTVLESISRTRPDLLKRAGSCGDR